MTDRTETILIAVTGMSPAILTETLWALAHPTDQSDPVIPNRIMVVTTASGRDPLLQLFKPSVALGNMSPWDALRNDLEQRGFDISNRLRFGPTPDDIRVITGVDPVSGQSVELSDLRTPMDNDAAADFLLETVRSLVENPDTQVIASLAGGRKTMGALLYACMTLIARTCDRLTHVLVSEPFESMRGFWFPGQPGGFIRSTGNGEEPSIPLDPATAVVQLADVPFVPLRNILKQDLGRKAGRFRLLIAMSREGVHNQSTAHLRIRIDTRSGGLEVNGCRVKVSAAEFALLLFLAKRVLSQAPPIGAYKEGLDPFNKFRKTQIQGGDSGFGWRLNNSLNKEWEVRQLEKNVSSLRSKLQKKGGDAVLLSHCLPEKGRLSLELSPTSISIE